MFYAHIREDGQGQSVEAHLKGTAQRCAAFAAQFGEEDRGRLLGYAHDLGKFTQEFQNRLHGGPKTDHTTAGAVACLKESSPFSACCVMGHHGGLPDFGNPLADPPGAPTFAGRMKKGLQQPPSDLHWKGTLPSVGAPPEFSDDFTRSFWIKMLYSCLVDADYLDTEAFLRGSTVSRGEHDPLPLLLGRLNTYILPWFPPKTPLNRSRCHILKQCLDSGPLPRGAYSLTVPTGGGKTVASLAFALKHAVVHGMRRVIYVLPYTSVIEQTAAVFREILGSPNVVEHHCSVDWDSGEASRSLRLAAENWDAPVIVTTAVQFFESLYANRPSRCRKLHNMVNSVILFDEAQMLPMGHLLPCVGAMANLTAHFRSTVVLCTATQPVLGDLMQAFCPGLTVTELCPDAPSLFAPFPRVTFRNGGKLSMEALAEALSLSPQVLCIVNTRTAARQVFDLLPPEGRFHLSTWMYPAHRRAVLNTIRERLSAGLPCRVVSTSLMEAGVDVDFPAVFRESAGLDALIQAAGRCNREGKRPAEESIVTYFEGTAPAPLPQRVNIAAAKEALAGGRNPGTPESIQRYFTALRALAGDCLDKTGTVDALRSGLQGCLLPFETTARNFRFLDQTDAAVYVPLGAGKVLCQALLENSAGKGDYRKAGQYSVRISQGHYRALLEESTIQPISENRGVLLSLELYDPETGLSPHPGRNSAESV